MASREAGCQLPDLACDLDFERADAAASQTTLLQAGKLRRGSVAMLRGRPCRIVEVATSKPGKHGHAKAHLVGVDLFTGRKYEEISQTSHSVEVPCVRRTEYLLSLVNEHSGSVSLLRPSGELRCDLDLPGFRRGAEAPEADARLQREILEAFRAGRVVEVAVLAACGEEKIVAVRATD